MNTDQVVDTKDTKCAVESVTHSGKRNHWSERSIRLLAVSLLFGSTVLAAPLTEATTVPAAAVALYKLGLSSKKTAPASALIDFQEAATLAPNWEPPLYEAGALLAVSDFPKAIPVLLKAALIAPHDDTVWNILGWGYYQHRNFKQAELSFEHQLRIAPGSGPGLWGLANCYGNSTIRAFTQSRFELDALSKQPQYRAQALKLLANLPPDAVDPTYHPEAPVTYEDAIAMALSYRSDTLHYPVQTVLAQNHQPASAAVASYVTWAAEHGTLRNLPIPSFQAPATRLGLALLLAGIYGINNFDYIRPFPLTDLTNVPVDEQMTINSILANRLLTPVSTAHFLPNGTMTRAAFAAVVTHANVVMATPPVATTLLTPPAPATRNTPFVYLFSTSQPDASAQEADLATHAGSVSGIGMTDYPFISDFPAGSARTREKTDHTQYLLTAASAGPAVTGELAALQTDHIGAFMVLANYNNVTHKSDAAIVHQMLRSASTRQSLIEEISAIVAKEQLAGVTVDFENIEASDRGTLVAFLQGLHQSLAAQGKKTMICLPERDQSTGGSSPYDYAALGQNADYVMLITYDEHAPGGPAGAISTLSNTQRVVQYATELIAPDKILLGAADYGYDWTGYNATEVSMDQAEALAISHDATIHMDSASDTPTFTYTDSAGVNHAVWFENEASLQAVASLVKQYGLLGLSVWHLGADDAAFWQAVQTLHS